MKSFLPVLKSALVTSVLLVFLFPEEVHAQACGGNIIRGATTGFLNPDGGTDIVQGGTGFTNCAAGYVDEMLEFEPLINPAGCASCQVGWTAIDLGEETDSDLWAGGGGCGSTDIVPDAANGSYGYFTVRDPDGICSNGDELLIFRIRLDANTNGSFSYSILFDADDLLGPDDPQGVICGSKGANAGFEYEIVANPGNGGTIEVRNIDGVYGTYGTDAAHTNSVPSASYSNATHYNQANACRSICSTSPCNQSGAVYHSFGVLLSDVGETCGLFDFRFAGMSASSGGGTLSSGTSVSDLGGAGTYDCTSTLAPCDCCTECNDPLSEYYCGSSAADVSNCLMGCTAGCVAETNNPFPVQLVDFYGSKENGAIKLNWITASENGCDFYELSRSADGMNFVPVGEHNGAGHSTNTNRYNMVDPNPHAGLNYYRLKQVDLDGKASYLSTIMFTSNDDFMVTMQTLVSGPELNLKLYNETDELDIAIHDTQGRLLRTESVKGQGRISNHTVDVSTLDRGVFILSVKSGNAVKRLKFVRL